MRNLIYQYWDGTVRPSALYGSKCMKAYAERIGADYVFDINSRWAPDLGKATPYYGCFKPIFDEKLSTYDNVMFADTDVFPVEGLSESIFDHFTGDLAMATEPLQPEYRYSPKLNNQCNKDTEETWCRIVEKFGSKPPRDELGRLKVYNSGVVLYSNKGMETCRKEFIPFRKYVTAIEGSICRGKVYRTDQGYIHAMAFAMNIDFQELDNEWNRYITWDPYSPRNGKSRVAVDSKTPNTKMVHVQMRGADNMSDDWHWTVVNRPKSEWGSMKNGAIIK
jgi:hypothetical protein